MRTHSFPGVSSVLSSSCQRICRNDMKHSSLQVVPEDSRQDDEMACVLLCIATSLSLSNHEEKRNDARRNQTWSCNESKHARLEIYQTHLSCISKIPLESDRRLFQTIQQNSQNAQPRPASSKSRNRAQTIKVIQGSFEFFAISIHPLHPHYSRCFLS